MNAVFITAVVSMALLISSSQLASAGNLLTTTSGEDLSEKAKAQEEPPATPGLSVVPEGPLSPPLLTPRETPAVSDATPAAEVEEKPELHGLSPTPTELAEIIERMRAYVVVIDEGVKLAHSEDDEQGKPRLESVEVAALTEFINESEAAFAASRQAIAKGTSIGPENYKANIKALLADAVRQYCANELSDDERFWLQRNSLFQRRVHAQFAEALYHQVLAVIRNDLQRYMDCYSVDTDTDAVVKKVLDKEPQLYRQDAGGKWVESEAVLKLAKIEGELNRLPPQKDGIGASVAAYQLPLVQPSLAILYDFVHPGEDAELRRIDSLRNNLLSFGSFLRDRVVIESDEKGKLRVQNTFHTSTAEKALHDALLKYCKANAVTCTKRSPESKDGEYTQYAVDGVDFNHILSVVFGAYAKLSGQCSGMVAEMAAITVMKYGMSTPDEHRHIIEMADAENDAVGQRGGLVEGIRTLRGVAFKYRSLEGRLKGAETSPVDSPLADLRSRIDATSTMNEPCTPIAYEIAATPPAAGEDKSLPEKMRTVLRRLAALAELLSDGVDVTIADSTVVFNFNKQVAPRPSTNFERSRLREKIAFALALYQQTLMELQRNENRSGCGSLLPEQELENNARVEFLFELFSILERGYNTVVVGWAKTLGMLDNAEYRALIKEFLSSDWAPSSALNVVGGYKNLAAVTHRRQNKGGYKPGTLPSSNHALHDVLHYLMDGHVASYPSTGNGRRSETAPTGLETDVYKAQMTKVSTRPQLGRRRSTWDPSGRVTTTMKRTPSMVQSKLALSGPPLLRLAWIEQAPGVIGALKKMADMLLDTRFIKFDDLSAQYFSDSFDSLLKDKPPPQRTPLEWRAVIAASPEHGVKEAIYGAIQAYADSLPNPCEFKIKSTCNEPHKRAQHTLHVVETLFAVLRQLRDVDCAQLLRSVEPFVDDAARSAKEGLENRERKANLTKRQCLIEGWLGSGHVDPKVVSPNFGSNSKMDLEKLRSEGKFRKMLEQRLVLECPRRK